MFPVKNDYNGEIDLSLLLRKLNRPLAKLFSNKISITFLVKSEKNQKQKTEKKCLQL